MQGSSEQPLVGEEHCVTSLTTLITAAKETRKNTVKGFWNHHISFKRICQGVIVGIVICLLMLSTGIRWQNQQESAALFKARKIP